MLAGVLIGRRHRARILDVAHNCSRIPKCRSRPGLRLLLRVLGISRLTTLIRSS